MKSFDEWYKEAKKLNDDGFSAKDFFEAGQKSKQAEVDELRKRIDDLDKQLFVQKGLNRFLKGKSNDN